MSSSDNYQYDLTEWGLVMSDTSINGVANAFSGQPAGDVAAGFAGVGNGVGSANSFSNSSLSNISDMTYPSGGSDGAKPKFAEMFKQIAEMLMSFMQQLIDVLMGQISPQDSSGVPTGGASGSSGTGDPTTDQIPPSSSSSSANPEQVPSPSAPSDSSTEPDDTVKPNEAEETPGASPGSEKMNLQAVVDDTGQTVVLTEDGYSIRCEGRDQAWVITGPDGKSTRIWGDPHVYESDGDRWDFYERSTFVFGNNKITVETVPYNGNEKVTLSGTIHIYNGAERVTITDIDKNTPKITAVTADGQVHDAGLADGDTYSLGLEEGSNEEEWTKQDTTKIAA